jgi:hypothetical protein
MRPKFVGDFVAAEILQSDRLVSLFRRRNPLVRNRSSDQKRSDVGSTLDAVQRALPRKSPLCNQENTQRYSDTFRADGHFNLLSGSIVVGSKDPRKGLRSIPDDDRQFDKQRSVASNPDLPSARHGTLDPFSADLPAIETVDEYGIVAWRELAAAELRRVRNPHAVLSHRGEVGRLERKRRQKRHEVHRTCGIGLNRIFA